MGRVMSVETRQKLSEALMGNENSVGRVVSEETRRKISKGNLGKVRSEELKRQWSEAHLGLVSSMETRRKISEGNKGKVVSEETRQKLSVALTSESRQRIAEAVSRARMGHEVSEETRQRISIANTGHKVAEETKRKVSETMIEKWKDPEYAKRLSELQHRSPNERELQLQSVLDKHFPGEWKYTGDGKDEEGCIGGKNPDFMNVNGEKQVIEVFGYYWHDPDVFPNRMSEGELIAHYREYGFDCLVFWEFDVYNEEEVVERITKAFKKEKR